MWPDVIWLSYLGMVAVGATQKHQPLSGAVLFVSVWALVVGCGCLPRGTPVTAPGTPQGNSTYPSDSCSAAASAFRPTNRFRAFADGCTSTRAESLSRRTRACF